MKKKTLAPSWIILALIWLTACQAHLVQPRPAAAPAALPAASWVTLDYAPAPADNPLKGFAPFYDGYSSVTNPIANGFPHSMEFFYVPLKNLMRGMDDFTFETGLEPQLQSIASRGHQAIFRVYLDYPGRVSGIPNFLVDAGLKVRDYPYFSNRPGQSVSPDYNDPRLVQALEAFIAALGKRCDGDPRIGFIQVGLIGFWGEWHTWPMDGYTQEDAVRKAQPDPKEENWMPSDDNQLRILSAFDAAFNKTRILVRYPAVKPAGRDAAPGFRAPYQSVGLNIGYHDDSFAYETTYGLDWYFMSKMDWRGAINTWKTQPIGGELRPEIQLGIWLDALPKNAQDFITSVEVTHASWMVAHAMFTASTMQPGSAIYERALAGARRMGYEFYVPAAKIQADGKDALQVSIRIENDGVAPFYYDWPAQLGVVDQDKRLAATWAVPWKLSEVGMPLDQAERYVEWSFTQPAPGLKPGVYHLLLGVENPLPGGKPVSFANQAQDADLKGWLTLGTFTIED